MIFIYLFNINTIIIIILDNNKNTNKIYTCISLTRNCIIYNVSFNIKKFARI
nr:MAG TPA: hypothetical protein [Crassvirales sp.]